ncbi:hypothetical protein RHGRI_001908 [Rhododendron griersonianum]|uniref:Uncharacterized protein n=1 Tax=Rhododendron griersonianum TaxID=479676 RepID=A0AAV6LMQ0_9ERIC|nr:hypothetical protein RHGRI_001908 [Rhododendron griersonianum]
MVEDENFFSTKNQGSSLTSPENQRGGTPVGKFKMQKDLRKGDPLCPLLSIIVVEGLNWLYEKTNYKALIKYMQIGEDGLCVTRLLFTDDIDFL